MREALGPTAREFAEVVMKPIIQAGRSLQNNAKYKRYFPGDAETLYSFDSARIHQAALVKDPNGTTLLTPYWFQEGVHRVPLPPYSPDMHKVIEHTHAVAEAKFGKWLMEDTKKYNIEEYKAKFEQIYRESCTHKVVAADVQTLHDTYDAIVNVGGDWPVKEFR